MKRAIKFRGRVINRKAAVGNEAEIGDLVTGSLSIYEEEPARRRCWIKRQEKNHVHIDYPVDEDSISQLVGYDKDGREVYEGDKLVSVDNGAVWVAVLNPTVTLPKYEHLESSNLELSGLKLQENQS